jgi:hypothetical protein
MITHCGYERIGAVLKLRGSRLLLASGVWLTIYVVCVLVVASFIFFEVLDVDGSDFPTHRAKMAVRLAEPPHDDIKRMWLSSPVRIWRGAALLEIRQPERRDRDVPAVELLPKPVREPRAALPRAALADVPPSAA